MSKAKRTLEKNGSAAEVLTSADRSTESLPGQNGVTATLANGTQETQVRMSKILALIPVFKGDAKGALNRKVLRDLGLPIPLTERDMWEAIDPSVLSAGDLDTYNRLAAKNQDLMHGKEDIYRENEQIVEDLE